MEKSKKNFRLIFAATALIACNVIACNARGTMEVTEEAERTEEVERTEEIIETEEIEIFGDTVDKIGDCLYEQVPEIDDWAEYVERRSEGEAYLYSRYDSTVIDVYRDGEGSEYLGKYYLVYVGEMWEDHSVVWSYFYVSVNYDEVLWKDNVRTMESEHETYTLEEWRNSPFYHSIDK